ncbi:prolyl oligopeptidase family serine peptidase [Planctomycetes bacterium K23_9]|uniref:Prolyl oligopeptidase family protein n=1 Tax=Stieleria marina TaxID=1930275 RepID=A0A517NM42_9BACT|nr:Prolyl oligopeptidase family protein [Planctomycetes bacterium K23_9]
MLNSFSRAQFVCLSIFFTVATGIPSQAQQNFKQLPPLGIKIDVETREKLAQRVARLKEEIEDLEKASEDTSTWRADVVVLVRAVELALRQNGFYKKSEPAAAAKLLDEAKRRIDAVAASQRSLGLLRTAATESDQPSLLVGGFVSHIDDSVQPYGLVLPVGFDAKKTYRLDVWLHGRGDTKLEVAFLTERMNKVGQYAPADTIVLHPFGRHCNAFKFAGETDVYEAIDHVSGLLNVDQSRVALRGFSMGGAGVWHLAAHDPTHWFAANPGAGFVDTIVYQGWAEKLPYPMTDARKKLLRLYDVLPWTSNLQNTQLIAYSGEVDKQRQAADRVMKAGKELGFDWDYVIGKGMGHKINPESATKVDAKLASWSAQTSQSPRKSIDFTTYTLRYAKADWLTVTGLQEHWKAGNVKAVITESATLDIKTDGVTHLSLDFADSSWPGKKEVGLNIDGERFYISDTSEEPGLQCQLQRGKRWEQVVGISSELRKRPGVQGPIDDVFYDRFLFVLPTRPAGNGVVERWVKREIEYAMSRWKRLMRGEVRTVRDVDLTDEQIKNNHLICFGDFLGNRYLSKVSNRMPLTWTRNKLNFAGKSYDPATHAAVMCYPNPENPDRYIVMNSGMTFREFSNVSNSRQIAMLPDWAMLKIDDEFDDSIFAGDVVAEGFFDEQWQIKTKNPTLP